MERKGFVVQDVAGNAVRGASVLIKTFPGNVTATLYADNESTTIANPMTTDATGQCFCKAANGHYTQTISKTGVVSETQQDIVFFDPDDLTDSYAASTGSGLVGHIATGAGAVATSVQAKLREQYVTPQDYMSDEERADVAAFTALMNVTTAVQAAVNYAILKKKPLYVPSGVYLISSIQVGSNFRMVGAGAAASVFKQSAVGSAMFNETSASGKSEIYIDSIGFDVNSKDSGINITNVSSLTIKNCNFANNPYWGIHVGIETARETTTTQTCEDILIENCRFDNSTSTYEHIVLFNGKNMVVRDCQFVGAMSGGIGVGLYQNLRGVTISGCLFRDITKGLYYSITTNEISISDCEFVGCTIGVQGANESDHGLFGEQWVYGLSIDNCRFYANDWAVEVGSVRGGSLSDCHFERNISNALVFSYGNRLSTPTIQQSVNINVSGCHFINNNQSGVNHSTHPGILFNEGGGVFYGAITGCTFEDSQATKTQYYAVAFNGAFNWSGIRMFGCRLAYYSTGASIAVINSATLSDVKLYGCMDLSTLPAGVTTA